MNKISPEIYAEVIRLHVKGYSMGEIAKTIDGISKTSVNNIIHDWNKRVSAGDIEEIRFFMRTLRKSDITIEKCIEGFRIQQMLKEFEISEEQQDWMIEEDAFTNSISSVGSSGNSNSNNDIYNSNELKRIPKEESLLDLIDLGQGERSQTDEKKNDIEESHPNLNVNPVLHFILSLYKECKTHKIAPSTAGKWIRDMLDFFSVTTCFSNSTSNEQSFVDIQKYFIDDGKGYDSNCHIESSSIPYTEHTSNRNVQNNPALNVIDLPLISKVPFFIDQNKKKIKRLLEIEKTIIDRIHIANEQKIKKESEVNTLVKKHKEIFRYFRWYNNLDQELSAKYNIRLENEIEAFCNAINDFKSYNSDPWQIISEYKRIESLSQVRESMAAEINRTTPIRDRLSNQVSVLNNQLSWCNQTIGIYNELCIYGYGLKDLKILRQMLAQIAVSNNMRPEEIGRKFLKDVEEQYDDKVGFENKIAELKIEKTKIEEEIPNYKSTLILQTWAVPSLSYLYKNGVSDIDIISISGLVSDFKNNDFLSNLLWNQNYNNDIISKVANSILNTRYNNNSLNNNEKQNKLENWQLFIQKLRELKNLDNLLKSRNLYSNKLYAQIKELSIRKQNLESLYGID